MMTRAKIEDIRKIFTPKCSGDMSFIEDLLPPHFHLYHMDSFNSPPEKEGKRFQGVVWHGKDIESNGYCADHMPIEILAISKKWKVSYGKKEVIENYKSSVDYSSRTISWYVFTIWF